DRGKTPSKPRRVETRPERHEIQKPQVRRRPPRRTQQPIVTRVRVRTTPAGAELYLNQEFSGQSPALLRFSGESATLLVYSAGYKTVRLKIQRGQRTISLVLRKK
ncbi:MAG: PEGA domain-containing protein, partial [Myxococcales bacterium]|nr:PEGA domain-containing protein [Myxococcales bacterium]